MDESSLSLSPSKLDASSASLLPPSTPIQHDRRFITELSRYTTLYARITAFGEEGPDLEQLTYAFNEEELRLLLRMNSLLFWEDVRDPKTGAYRCEEKSKPHKVAVLHSNLHKLRPAGELRKMASGTGAFFERWPEVRPSTADVFAQEQTQVSNRRRGCATSMRDPEIGSAMVPLAIVQIANQRFRWQIRRSGILFFKQRTTC